MNDILSTPDKIQTLFRAAQSSVCRISVLVLSRRNLLVSDFQLAAFTVTKLIKSAPKVLVVVTPAVSDQEILEKSCTQVAALVSPPEPCELKLKKSKRKNPLTVRLSDIEREMVIAKANRVGCSVNSYIKAAALSSDYRPPINRDLTNALLMLNREFTAQGNNLNQIAKHLNGNALTQAQGSSMLNILGRSMLQTHKAVRKALAHGEPEP